MKNLKKSLIAIAFLTMVCLWSFAQSTEKQTPPAGSAPRAFKLPKVEKFTLPNGLQVTLVPFGSIPKVMIDVTVRAGNLNESAQQIWLADFTGELLKEGTTSRTSEQVAQQAAGMGGAVSVNVGPDVTQISGDVLSEFAPQMAKLLADVVQHPLLPESEVSRLKQDFQRQLSVQKSQPQTLARERFYQALYPDHPYGRILSSDSIINSFTADAAKKFYDDNFGAARTHIYVAGKFDPAAMKSAITQSFSSWKRGAEPLIQVPTTTAKHEVDVVDRPGAAQSTVYVGLPTIDPSNSDFIQLQVMNTLLGGSFGSRITANIREQKGYTYSPNSQLSVRYRDAFWAEVADVTTAVTGPSIKEILYEIDRLQKTAPADAELNGVKNYLGGIFVIQNSSRVGLIGRLQYSAPADAELNGVKNYLGGIFVIQNSSRVGLIGRLQYSDLHKLGDRSEEHTS